MEKLRFSDYCANCRVSLADIEKVYFVEKDIGRCFCTEECIKEYFQPAVQFMEEELDKLHSKKDFAKKEYARFTHYRFLTLQDPDEVWLEQVESGEKHYVYISHFQEGGVHFSYIVVCLTIEGEPSFVFLSFPTKEDALVDEYRRGTDLKIRDNADPTASAHVINSMSSPEESNENPYAQLQLADEESFEKINGVKRSHEDISPEDFPKFKRFIEPTLDDPDEIWTFTDDQNNKWLIFIGIYQEIFEMKEDSQEDAARFAMIVVCKPKCEKGARAFDIILAMPTIDPQMLQSFRKGINSLNKAFGVGWTGGMVA